MESEQPIYPELCFDASFRFSCGEHQSCFVECCTGTKIWLYPYDVIRISRSLVISTTDFIQRFCWYMDPAPPGYPVLLLQNADEGEGRCPFAEDSGCSVYPDRPWICRLFPVVPLECRTDLTTETDRRFKIFCWEGCRGVGNGPEVTVREWWQRAGMAIYEETYLDWQRLTEELKCSGQLPLSGEKAELFKLGSYDLDLFRQQFLAGELREELPLMKEELEKADKDDMFLLQISCRWLQRVLLG